MPGPPKQIRALITGADGALVTWLDPQEPNGIISKFTVYWRELLNNRTKTSITIPRSMRANSNSMTGNLLQTASSGNLNMGAKYFYYLLKNGLRRKYRRLPDFNNNNQYKLSALKENVEYQVFVTATNRIGEGAASPLISFKPTRTTEPKIFEFSQSIPFRSTSGQGESTASNLSAGQLPNADSHSNSQSGNGGTAIAGEQSGQSLPVLLTCTVLSTERVTRKWTMISASAEHGSANSSDSVTLDHEPDGSLLINVNLEHLPANYSCSVSNSAGSDQVVYHLFKGKR